jgi:transposase-like protein
LFDSYQRRMAELDELMSQMFVGGVSQAKVGQVVEGLTGTAPSASTVSRVFHGLDDEFAAWKRRDLPARYQYVYGDGTYFTVIYEQDGQSAGHKTPILALIGITPEGRREVIAFTVGERENQLAWEGLFDDVKSRGVREIGLWISDGHQAMLNALAAKFPGVPRQRCIKHKMDNILAYVPEQQREAVRVELRAIFYQDNRTQAEQVTAAFIEKYRAVYPSAIECLHRDWMACLTFYAFHAFPKTHWARIRTSNVIERMFEEVKKRSKKMSAPFRNEGSCLLLFYAVVRSLKFQNVVMQSEATAVPA